jgi:MFS family permease
MGVLRHRDFRIFFIAASVSNGAGFMEQVAVPVLLYDLTGKATWLGIAAMASLIPATLLTPYAGVLADRVPRRTILIVTQTINMLTSLTLWLFYMTGHVNPWVIVGLNVFHGIAAGFQTSAWQSFVPMLVPEEDMIDAVRLNSVQFTLARAIGPAFAGVMVAAWSVGAAIFTNAITFLLVIGVLVVIRPRQNATAARAGRVRDVLVEGARYVWRHAPLRLAVLLGLVSSFFGQSLYQLSAAITADLFHHDSEDNAGLLVAAGVGSVVASFGAIALGARIRKSLMVAAAFGLYAVSAAITVSTELYVVGVIGFFFVGLGHVTSTVALNTMVQASVPDEVRGRTLSFFLLGILGGIPLGSLAIGRTADAIGFQPVLAFNGVVFALTALLVLRRADDLDVTEIGSDVRPAYGGPSPATAGAAD